MKIFFSLFCGISMSYSDQVARADFQEMIQDFIKEDWKPVHKKSGTLLATNPEDS